MDSRERGNDGSAVSSEAGAALSLFYTFAYT